MVRVQGCRELSGVHVCWVMIHRLPMEGQRTRQLKFDHKVFLANPVSVNIPLFSEVGCTVGLPITCLLFAYAPFQTFA